MSSLHRVSAGRALTLLPGAPAAQRRAARVSPAAAAVRRVAPEARRQSSPTWRRRGHGRLGYHLAAA